MNRGFPLAPAGDEHVDYSDAPVADADVASNGPRPVS